MLFFKSVFVFNFLKSFALRSNQFNLFIFFSPPLPMSMPDMISESIKMEFNNAGKR